MLRTNALFPRAKTPTDSPPAKFPAWRTLPLFGLPPGLLRPCLEVAAILRAVALLFHPAPLCTGAWLPKRADGA